MGDRHLNSGPQAYEATILLTKQSLQASSNSLDQSGLILVNFVVLVKGQAVVFIEVFWNFVLWSLIVLMFYWSLLSTSFACNSSLAF